MTFLPPAVVANNLVNAGVAKTKVSIGDMILKGCLSGFYLFFGLSFAIKAAVATGTYYDPADTSKYIANSLAFGVTFALGLSIIIITGASLFTGDTCVVGASLIRRRITILNALRTWGVVYAANVVSSIAVAWIFGYQTDIFAAANYTKFVTNVAEAKVSLTFGKAFLRAIACNWQVCLAVVLSAASTSVAGKFIGVVFPIASFAAVGFEHSIANAIVIPMGIFMGGDVTWYDFFIKNLLPVTLGNIVGGFLCTAGPLAYTHWKAEAEERRTAGAAPAKRRESYQQETSIELMDRSEVIAEESSGDGSESLRA